MTLTKRKHWHRSCDSSKPPKCRMLYRKGIFRRWSLTVIVIRLFRILLERQLRMSVLICARAENPRSVQDMVSRRTIVANLHRLGSMDLNSVVLHIRVMSSRDVSCFSSPLAPTHCWRLLTRILLLQDKQHCEDRSAYWEFSDLDFRGIQGLRK